MMLSDDGERSVQRLRIQQFLPYKQRKMGRQN